MAVDLVDPELKTEREEPMSNYDLDQILLEAKIAVDRERKRPGSGVGISTSRYDKSTQGTMRVPAAMLVALVQEVQGNDPVSIAHLDAMPLRLENEKLRKERDAARRRIRELERRPYGTANKDLAGNAVAVAADLRKTAARYTGRWKTLPDHLCDLAARLHQADGSPAPSPDFHHPAGTKPRVFWHGQDDADVPVGTGPIIVDQDARHVPDGYTVVTELERSTVPVHTFDGQVHQTPIRSAKVGVKPPDGVAEIVARTSREMENKYISTEHIEKLTGLYGREFAAQELQQQFVRMKGDACAFKLGVGCPENGATCEGCAHGPFYGMATS